MDTSQRAMVAARVATLAKGGDRRSENFKVEFSTLNQSEAAETLNVSRESVISARKVIDKAAPEVAAAVDAGILPVSQASKLADKPPEYQKAIVERVKEGAKVSDAIREANRIAALGQVRQQIAEPADERKAAHKAAELFNTNRAKDGAASHFCP